MRLEVEQPSMTDPEAVDVVDVVAKVLDDEWLLRATYELADDGPVLSSLTFTPATDTPDVLGAALLRRLRLGAVVDEFTELLKEPFVVGYLGPDWRRRPARPGRAGTDDLVYAEWAERYVQALEVAPTKPIEHIVATSDEFVTATQVRAYLTRARNRRPPLLTPAPPGRPGGELTDHARRLLAQRDEATANRKRWASAATKALAAPESRPRRRKES